MKFSLPLILVLAASPLMAQNVQFSADLDMPNNVIGWSVVSSVGSINVSPSTFRLGGTMDFKLDSANAPFTSGSFNGSLAFTNPNTLHGTIPNPLPFFPPLVEFDLTGLEFAMSTPSFTIDPVTGDFTTDVTLVVTRGQNVMTGLLGNSNESVAGLVTAPTTISGNVSQSGTVIDMWMDLNLQIDMVDAATGVTSTVTFTGDIDCFTYSTDANSMHLDVPYGMTGGASSTLSFTNATPSSTVYLAGSGSGRGVFSVPSLGVDIGMNNPQHAATASADGSGNGSFSLYVPSSMVGLSVLLQTVQSGHVSNVAGTFIQ
ncbi:MAG: hypothetical protein H8E25_06085 [Planctomycetes bacterium]|nr:hypothetical protein [Planctomycetota bacterium]